MSISTYEELKTAVANRLRRADTSSFVDDWILLAETEIYRRLRVKEMEAALSVAISGGVAALPSGYIDLKFAYISAASKQRLARKTAAWIYENYPARVSGRVPQFIAREGSNFIFGPDLGDGYTVSGIFYKNLGAVSSTAHALFTSNPDVYLYGSLLMAVRELKDDKGIARWQPLFEQTIMSAQKASDGEEWSGGALAMTVG